MLTDFIEYILYTVIATAVITIFYVYLLKIKVKDINFRIFMIFLVISLIYYLLRKKYSYNYILKLSGFLVILLLLGLIGYHTINLIMATKFKSGKGITVLFTLMLITFFLILMRNVIGDEFKAIFIK